MQFKGSGRSTFYIETSGISHLAALFLIGMEKAEASKAVSKINDINAFTCLLKHNHSRKSKREDYNYFGFDCAVSLVQKHRQISQEEIDSQEIVFTLDDLIAVVSSQCNGWDNDKWISLKMATITRLPGVKNKEVEEYAEEQRKISSGQFAIDLAVHGANTLRSIEETQARVRKDLGIE